MDTLCASRETWGRDPCLGSNTPVDLDLEPGPFSKQQVTPSTPDRSSSGDASVESGHLGVSLPREEKGRWKTKAP
jgi:hypothetical protein